MLNRSFPNSLINNRNTHKTMSNQVQLSLLKRRPFLSGHVENKTRIRAAKAQINLRSKLVVKRKYPWKFCAKSQHYLTVILNILINTLTAILLTNPSKKHTKCYLQRQWPLLQSNNKATPSLSLQCFISTQ